MKKKSKERMGFVTSDKSDKTVVVTLEREFIHLFYGKRIRKRKRVKVHDENNQCEVGDLVKIVETRPLSKEKHWKISQIIKKRGL